MSHFKGITGHACDTRDSYIMAFVAIHMCKKKIRINIMIQEMAKFSYKIGCNLRL